MRYRTERSKITFKPSLSAGFTLVEVMVLVSALTLLAIVISAPKTHTSDLRRAALTISRVHDIVVTAKLYRTYVGQWPRKNGCVILGSGVKGESLYDGYKITAITGWGDEISVKCNDKDKEYEITYPVPSEWAEMFESQLEATNGKSDVGNQKVISTVVNMDGELGSSIYFSNNELVVKHDSERGIADIDGCKEDEEESVFYAPNAVCFSDLSDNMQGRAIRSNFDSGDGVVTMSRIVYSPPVGETPEQYLSHPPAPTCDRKENRHGEMKNTKVRVKALVQCKKK